MRMVFVVNEDQNPCPNGIYRKRTVSGRAFFRLLIIEWSYMENHFLKRLIDFSELYLLCLECRDGDGRAEY